MNFNIYIVLVFFITCLYNCQKDIEHVIIDDEQKALIERAETLMANMQLRNYNKGKNFHYVGKTWGEVEKQNSSLALLVAAEQNKAMYQLDLQTLHRIVQNKIKSLGINPMKLASFHDASLQIAAYEVAHRAGLKEVASDERDELLEYYMDIIIAQRGIDCDAMAELVVVLKSRVDESKYQHYKSYVLDTAYSELSEVTSKLEEYRSNSDEASLDSRTASTSAAIAHLIDRYLSAKTAIDLLANS